MAFENLSVRISAATRNFERKMENASDSVSEFGTDSIAASAGVQTLQNRLDELEDELSAVDREAGSANRSLTLLTGTTTGLSAATSALSTAALPGLIVSLGTLATVAAPLVATFGGLGIALGGVATGAAAVIGSGLLAYGQKLGQQNARRLSQIRSQIAKLEALSKTEQGLSLIEQKRLNNLKKRADKLKEQTGIMGGLQSALSELKKELKPIVTDLGKTFIPLIKEIIEDIPNLVRNIIQAISPLNQFANAIRNVWNIAQKVLPNIIGRMVDFGEKALPAVVSLSNSIANNLVPAMEGLMDVTSETLPLLEKFADPIMKILPLLTEFGLQTLKLVDGPLATLIDIGVDALEWFNNLPESIQNAAIAAGVLSGALIGVLPALTSIAGVISAIGSAVSALSFESLLVVGDALLQVGQYAALMGSFVAINFGLVSKWFNRVRDVALDFFNQIRPSINQFIGIFQDARPQITAFLTAVNNMFRGLFDAVMSVLVPVNRAILTEFIAPLTKNLIDALDGRIQPLFRELAILFQNIVKLGSRAGRSIIKAWKSVDQIVVPILRTLSNLLIDGIVFGLNQAFNAAMLVLNLLNGDFAGAIMVAEKAVNSFEGAIINLAKNLTVAVRNAVISATETLGQLLADRINSAIPNQVLKFDLPDNPVEMANLSTTMRTKPPQPAATPTPARSQRGQQQSETNVMVEVTGDTDVVEEVTARKIEETERRTNRQVGRNITPQ